MSTSDAAAGAVLPTRARGVRAGDGRGAVTKPILWILAIALGVVAVVAIARGASPFLTLLAGLGVGILIAAASRNSGGRS